MYTNEWHSSPVKSSIEGWSKIAITGHLEIDDPHINNPGASFTVIFCSKKWKFHLGLEVEIDKPIFSPESQILLIDFQKQKMKQFFPKNSIKLDDFSWNLLDWTKFLNRHFRKKFSKKQFSRTTIILQIFSSVKRISCPAFRV